MFIAQETGRAPGLGLDVAKQRNGSDPDGNRSPLPRLSFSLFSNNTDWRIVALLLVFTRVTKVAVRYHCFIFVKLEINHLNPWGCHSVTRLGIRELRSSPWNGCHKVTRVL
jgi:hypothetical protein